MMLMEILSSLLSQEEWLRFFDYKKSGGHLTSQEETDLKQFIENKEYLATAEKLNRGGVFSLPSAVQINKAFSDKKRTVFTFSREENYIQKMLAYQLLSYDHLFCGNLYSFRRNQGVKKAIQSLVHNKKIKNLYSYKLDISDYFNSVDPQLLLPMLEPLFNERFFSLIRELLLNPYAMENGEKKEMKKGIMAGSPLSGFFANLYLTDLDRYFEEKDICYARYSDDIIFFADCRESLEDLITATESILQKLRLSINEKKVYLTAPGDSWSFLGMKYQNGNIDISDISKQKLKKKMRRKARALRRWLLKKNAEPERAVSAFIRYFNKKLYENPIRNEITWCRWYFPLINTADSLKELDQYMQQCIRYIATGKQNKSAYNFRYEEMQRLGYTTLVHRYYQFRKDGDIIKNIKKGVDI